MPRPQARSLASASTVLLALCVPALSPAQDALPALPAGDAAREETLQPHEGHHHSEGLHTLDAVTVQTPPPAPYLTQAPPSVSGPLGLQLRQTPQSVSVFTRERMRDQGLISASDVLARSTGVTFAYHSSQEGVHASARGARLDNIMIDGLSLQGNQRKLPADLALYERVEILRGPAGLLVGSGTSGNPSGAINLVRKRPTREKQLHLLAAAASHDHWRSTLDASGPLNTDGSVRGRGILSRVERKFFYDHAWRKNLTLGGSLAWDMGPNTLLTIGADIEQRRALPGFARHFRNWDGSDPGGRRSSSSVLPWGQMRADESGVFAQIDHTFANAWKLATQYTRKTSRNFADYASVAYYVDGASGEYRHFIQSTWSKSRHRDEGFSANLHGTFDLLGRGHDFVVGMNWQDNRSRAVNIPASWRGAGYGRFGGHSRLEIVDFPNMDVSRYPWRPSLVDESQWNLSGPERQLGHYAHTRLNASDAIKIIGGLRVSRWSTDGDSKPWARPPVYRENANTKRGTVTPFLALGYDLHPQHTVHISHAEIFRVQNQYDLQGRRVDPLTGKNLELGLKSSWREGQLQSMLMLYRLKRSHGTWRVEESPCQSLLSIRGITAACYVANNQQRTTGLEFELNGSLAPRWDVALGLSAMRRKHVRLTEDGGRTSRLQGQGWTNTEPTRVANAWLLHRLDGAAQKWRIGLGMRAQNRIWQEYAGGTWRDASRSITARRPAFRVQQGGFATFGAMLSWDVTPKWRVQWNVENLTNRNYQTQFGSWYVSHSEPRSHMLTLTGQLD